MTDRKKLKIDWITIVIYLFMVMAGWLNIYSAVYSEEHNSIFDLGQRYGKQMLWIVFAFLFALFVIVIDSKFFVSFSFVFYGIFILLLIAVLFFGKTVNGAKAWFMIGSFQFQPSEFAKLGTAMALSKVIGSFNFKFSNRKNLMVIIAILAIPIGLIFLQNDTGSALVYSMFIIAFFREGMSGLILFFVVLMIGMFIFSLVASPLVVLTSIIVMGLIAYLVIRREKKEILYGLAALAVSTLVVWLITFLVVGGNTGLFFILLRSSILTILLLILFSIYRKIQQAPLILSIVLGTIIYTTTVDFVFNRVLEQHQRSRINNLIGVETDPLGAGYHVKQSKIAIGSGGFFGKGYLDGTQTKYNFVPEQSTDFIFCTVGEEWGFVGSIFIIGLFIFLMIRLVLLAERQRSVYSRVYGYCVVSIIFFHFAINIGMTIGLAPVIGIPLPFFSYGGSSLWFFTILLFIFLRLDASRFEVLR